MGEMLNIISLNLFLVSGVVSAEMVKLVSGVLERYSFDLQHLTD